ncbi:GDP-L-fucose synthase family protein [Aliikangiella maris]|uniref:GDP-L-fucose synthase n=2 Tax=Aliikangiella maris TaxID=3162458 RepID=A0ABV3MMJ8_9GAMM
MSKKIFVAGHRGMVGRAIVDKLRQDKNNHITTVGRDKLNLLDQNVVNDFFKNNPFDLIYIAAAKVGGIGANNDFPADFIYQNLMIESNIIHAAHQNNVPQLLFLGSSCIYPKLANQPIKEEYLLTGKLEPTNEPYAIAKIAGIKLSESYNRQFKRDYRCIMPTNLYGPFDNFDSENSHVIPGLMARIHHAKKTNAPSVTIWGSGKALREFLHVYDLAEAAVHLMSIDKISYSRVVSPMESHINVGSGEEVTIEQLAKMLIDIIDYKGELKFDLNKPDGTLRKLLDSGKINRLGWRAKVKIRQGLVETYDWYLKQVL